MDLFQWPRFEKEFDVFMVLVHLTHCGFSMGVLCFEDIQRSFFLLRSTEMFISWIGIIVCFASITLMCDL